MTNFRRRILTFSVDRICSCSAGREAQVEKKRKKEKEEEKGKGKEKEKEEEEEKPDDCMCGEMYCFTICGYAFLWHQVRCMVAVLFMVGRRDEVPEVVQLLLDIEKTPRKPSYEMASELPLVLFRCTFAKDALTWKGDPMVHSWVSHILWEKFFVSNMIRGTIGWAMWEEMKGYPVDLVRGKKKEEREVVLWRDYPKNHMPKGPWEKKHTPVRERFLEPSLKERVESMSGGKRKRYEDKFGKDGKGGKKRKQEEEE